MNRKINRRTVNKGRLMRVPVLILALLIGPPAVADSYFVHGFKGEPDRSTVSINTDGRFQRGYWFCSKKSEEYYESDPANIEYQYLYASCLVIKGRDDEGVPLLFDLCDHHSNLSSCFFLGDYLWTDGAFASLITEKNLNEAIHYYFRTLVIIKLIPSYPEPDYFFHEKGHQMELRAIYSVPYLYLRKYHLGTIGNYREHLFQSPSYQGDTSKETYPQYNTLVLDSLNKALRFAKKCASLPQKRHFRPDFYQATVKACDLMRETVLAMIPLEQKRREILLQPHCKDLNETVCPEYYETHTEIYDIMTNSNQVALNLFKEVAGR